MENLERPIVVPWDFSEVAENAFQHAVKISKILNRGILLLHVAKEERESGTDKKKLEESSAELGRKYGIKPGARIITGSIFHAIGQTAKELKAEMIIMGTHGMKGAQKLFGSRALKVVVSSRIPFLVVQDKPLKDTIDTILLPIDFKRENKEKGKWIHYLSRHFGARFIILKSNAKDKGFRRNILSNIKFVETYLKGNDVDYEIVTTPGKEKFKLETVRYARDHDVDLILVMATRDIKWIDYLLGAPEQYILANPENMPVMCLNPRPAKIAGGFRATGGA